MSEPNSAEKADRIVAGRALRNLRERSGMTLQEAVAGVRRFGQVRGEAPRGISVQRWQQAEKGLVRFSDEQISRFVEALGASVEDFEVQRAKVMGGAARSHPSGMGEREPRSLTIPVYGRAQLDADGWKIKDAAYADGAFDLKELVSPSIGLTHAADDRMRGLLEPGDPVIFDRARRPKAGRGCVIETNGGELYPRIFVGVEADQVLVKDMVSKDPVAFARNLVRGIYAVKFWGG